MDKTTKKTKEETKETSKDNSKDNSLDNIKKAIKNFDELKKEYDIPEEHITLKTVLDKMQEKVEYYIKILVQILQPEEFHSLHECVAFDDKEKNDLFDMYKSLMILHREIIKSDIFNEEKDMISTIDYAHAELKGYKKHMMVIVTKLQDSWKKTTAKKNIGYFG
jgi:hypothetical protein